MPANSTTLQQTNDELISEEVREIISYRPHWMVRKGNFVFFIVLIALLSLTWFISYPDKIDGSARLVSLNAPKMISSKVDGKLIQLFVTDGQHVKRGEHLAIMESVGSYDEITILKTWVDSTLAITRQKNYTALVQNPLPSLFNLGEIQASYQIFQNQFVETKQLLASGYYQNRKAALQKDLQYLANLKVNTYSQKNLLEEDKDLQKKELEAYESLEKDKVIAPLELNQYKSKVIAKEQSVKQINTQLTNADISAHSKVQEIMDLDKQILDQQQKFNTALLDLKSEIDKWMQQFVLMASEDGKIMFVASVQENELISSGQNLFYVQPKQTKYYAELMVGQKGLGKIKPGQLVILKADGFPSEEYGYLKGMVNYISNMPARRDSFLLKVSLPYGLKTNYNKEIFFRNNLSANAQIITDDRKLFERLLEQLKSVGER